MDVIELFIVLCTVVLLCSWSFIIYTNWKGRSDLVKFPPYGYDDCPIGYQLDKDGTKCEKKSHLSKIFSAPADPFNKNVAAHHKLTSKSVCEFYNLYKNHDKKLAWDGLPTKSTYKDPEASKVRRVLDHCCGDDGTNTCSTLDFSRLIGKERDALGD